jgi:hypothetical protein
MILETGTKVLVRSLFDDSFEQATIVGAYMRDKYQLDSTGRFVISERGVVYQVRYAPDMGVYNVHESRIFPETKGVTAWIGISQIIVSRLNPMATGSS